ncbi:hypothetical protein SUGI_0253620 [Cryptomeria japonica]|nr:hypothetical protein SUGI_0253620 [Cryptomeria japonica]
MLTVLICLVLFGLEVSNGARILQENQKKIPCGEVTEMKPWITTANNETELTFRFKETRTRGDVKQESGSGPSRRENVLVLGEQLSKSKASPSVGHMQMRPQRKVSKKRHLQSTPSPGVGH